MNFNYFQKLIVNAEFDEIKVIGKDIKKENCWYHMLGMTLKDKKAFLYVLELTEGETEEIIFDKEETPRMSLKKQMQVQREQSFFMQIREFRCVDKVYETAGATAQSMRYGDYGELYLLFMKMCAAGWEVVKESPFYEAGWDLFSMIQIEFRDEFEHLPKWEDEMMVLVDSVPESKEIEVPVLLECGKTREIPFLLENEKEAVCYINKVYLMDIWKEEEKRFSDTAYREKMLLHVTEVEFEQMKENFFRVLEEHCPRGKCYMVVEYECSEEDMGLNFYDREYLEQKPEERNGSATALLMRIKPDTEVGSHGLKLRGGIIQKALLDKGTMQLDAELFSYYRMVGKRVEKL